MATAAFQFDVRGARKSGYSNQEILDEIRSDFDVDGARAAGYSDDEILSEVGVPLTKGEAASEMDRALTVRPMGPQSAIAKPKIAAPFYTREKPIHGTEQTGLPGVPQPQMNVEYDIRGEEPGAVMIPGKGVVRPPVAEFPRVPVLDTLMRAGNQATMGVVGGMGTAAQVLGQQYKGGLRPDAEPLGDLLTGIGEGVKEFAKRGTAPTRQELSYVQDSWLKDPTLLLDPHYVVNQVGQASGSMLAFLGPSIALFGAPTTFGSAIRTVLGSSGLESLVNAAEVHDAAKKTYGATDEEAAKAFTTALTRDLPVTALTNLAGLLNPLIKSKVVRMGAGAISEPIQEVAQGVSGRTVLKEKFDPNLSLSKGADVEALGGLIGGVMGGHMVGETAREPSAAEQEMANLKWSVREGRGSLQDLAKRRMELLRQQEQVGTGRPRQEPTGTDTIRQEPIETPGSQVGTQAQFAETMEPEIETPGPQVRPPTQFDETGGYNAPQDIEGMGGGQPQREEAIAPGDQESGGQPAEAGGVLQEPEVGSPWRRLMNAVKGALAKGESFNNPKFDALAEQQLGGSRAEGTFKMKEAYDALEAAVNEALDTPEGKTGVTLGEAMLSRSEDPSRDADWALRGLRELVTRLPTQNIRSAEQEGLQQFSTPPTLAWLANMALNPRKDDVVLEPSAGTGSLVTMLRRMVKKVMVNEIDPHRQALLKEQGYENITDADAEFLNGTLEAKGVTERPTAIVMNPPFSSTGGRVAKNANKFGYSHVMSALQRLAPGGRLVAILGEGATPTAPTARAFWGNVKDAYTLRANIGISGREYTKYGTTFGNRLIVIDKTGPTQAQPLTGDFENIEEAWNAIQRIADDRPSIGQPGGDLIADGVDQQPGLPETQQPDRQPDGGLRPGGERGPEGGDSGQPGPGERGGRDRLRGEGAGTRTEEGPQQAPASDATVQPPRPQPEPTGKGDRGPADDSGKRRLTPPTEQEIEQALDADIKQRSDDAMTRLRNKLRKSGASYAPSVLGFEPGELSDAEIKDLWPDLVEASAGLMRGRKASEWRAAMIGEFGEGIRNHLNELFESTHDHLEERRRAVVAQLAEPPQPEPQDQKPEEGGVDIEAKEQTESEEDEEGSNFAVYQPAVAGPPHPGRLVETKVMASVEAPTVTYAPNLPATIISEGRLSAAQLETVARAGMMHEQFDANGQRLGYLIGDGTGVGKGREIASIILDNHRNGRKRAVWVSAGKDLISDARRDFVGIGAMRVEAGEVKASDIGELQRVNKWPAGAKIPIKDGVIFTTFDTLKMAETKEGGRTRVEQIAEWLGQDGVIVFDEIHKAKNFLAAEKGAEGTQMGAAVVAIQEKLPKARIVYASATFASEVRHLAPLQRMGLWGDGTAFNGISEFMSEIGRGAVAGLELVARELKAAGKYLTRTISFKGVSYNEKLHPLTDEQQRVYDAAATAWQRVLEMFETQGKANGWKDSKANFASARFWTEHQRFFRILLTAMKVPTIIELTEQAIDQGKSVVISLILTGAAQTDREIEKAAQEEDYEVDFSPREIIESLVEKYYPVQLFEDYTDAKGATLSRPVVRDGKPVLNPEAVANRDALMGELKTTLQLPDSTLQSIINTFGRNQVAELTGRREEPGLVNGKPAKVTRVPEGVSQDDVNEHEKDQFQSGKKRIAVISKAAATGISLHADLDVANQQPRLHIVAELSWSADDQMQSLGRVHRSNQKQAPEYIIVSTDVGGERRFSSTIARRLDALGALTKGQRGTAGGAVLAKYNFETEQGKDAAEQFYKALYEGEVEFEHNTPHEVLIKMGMAKIDPETGELAKIKRDKARKVHTLLNRVLNLRVAEQNEVYDYFVRTFEAMVDRASQAGTLDIGVQTVRGDNVKLVASTVIKRDAKSGATTNRYHLRVTKKNHPLDVQSARHRIEQGAHMMRETATGNVLLAQRTDITTSDPRTGNVYRLWRILRPEHFDATDTPEMMTDADVAENLTRMGDAENKAWKEAVQEEERVEGRQRTVKGWLHAAKETKDEWSVGRHEQELEILAAALETVREQKVTSREAFKEITNKTQWKQWEKATTAAGPNRTEDIHMIGGSVLPIWNHLKPGDGKRMDIRMAYPEGKPSVVGVVVKEREANRIERALGGEGTTRSMGDIISAVMEGESVRLGGGLRLSRDSVNRKPVVRIRTTDPSVGRFLRDEAGAQYEKIGWQDWFYLPGTGEQAQTVLEKIVSRHPVIEEEEESSGGTAAYSPGGTAAFTGSASLPPQVAKPAVKGHPATRAGTPPVSIERRSEIIKDIAELFENKLPVRRGRFRQRAIGIYKVLPQVIRLKTANDIRTFSHELGHHLHNVFWGTDNRGLNNRPLAPWAAELKPMDYEPKKARLHEGFAEFVRYWLTDPKTAEQKAPRFFKDFEKLLDKHPDLKAGMYMGRDRISKWWGQPAAAQILGTIDKEQNDRRPWHYFRSWDEFYQNYIWSRMPIAKAVSEMAKASGNTPRDDEHAGKLAQLLPGWWGKARNFLESGTFDFKTLRTTGPGLQEILEPIARHGKNLGPATQRIMNDVSVDDNHDDGLDDLRVYMIAMRGVELSARGIQSGHPVSVYQQAIQELEQNPERARLLRNAAADLYTYQDGVLQYYRDAGMLSQYQYMRIKRLNQMYIPMYRVSEEFRPTSGKASAQKIADVTGPVKKIHGSQLDFVDPLESVIKNTFAMISAAERNYVGRMFVKQADLTHGAGRLVEWVPSRSVPTRFQLEEIKKQLEDAGAVLDDADLSAIGTIWRPAAKQTGNNVLSVIERGERQYYQVAPELYDAMTVLDRGTATFVATYLGKAASLLRAGATAYNPEFILRNPIRDAFTAMMQSEYGFKPGLDTLRGLELAIAPQLEGKIGGRYGQRLARKAETFREWQRAGGEHAAQISVDRQHLQETLRGLLGSKGLSAVHPLRAARMLILGPLAFAGETTERATRLREYEMAREHGVSPRGAAVASRNVTIDFGRRGIRGTAVNLINVFWNAQVQSTVRFAQLHDPSDPKQFMRSLTRGVVGLTLPSLLLWLLNNDDPEYQELEQWRKDLFWNIPTPQSLRKHNWNFISIPKPFLWGAVYGTGLGEHVPATFKKDARAWKGYLGTLYSAAAPTMLPSGFVPPIEVLANKNLFTWRSIDPKATEHLSPQYRARSTTTEFSKSVVKGLAAVGAATGTDLLNISPNKLDHLIFGYTGGAGRLVLSGVDEAIGTNRPTPRLSSRPLARVFVVGRANQPESVEEFYDEYGDLMQKQADYREGVKRPEGAASSADDLSGKEKARLARLKPHAKTLTELHKEYRAVFQAKKQSPSEKRVHLDRINTAILNQARTALGRPAMPRQ